MPENDLIKIGNFSARVRKTGGGYYYLNWCENGRELDSPRAKDVIEKITGYRSMHEFIRFTKRRDVKSIDYFEIDHWDSPDFRNMDDLNKFVAILQGLVLKSRIKILK